MGVFPIMLSHRQLLIYVRILGVTPLQPCSVGYEVLFLCHLHPLVANSIHHFLT